MSSTLLSTTEPTIKEPTTGTKRKQETVETNKEIKLPKTRDQETQTVALMREVTADEFKKTNAAGQTVLHFLGITGDFRNIRSVVEICPELLFLEDNFKRTARDLASIFSQKEAETLLKELEVKYVHFHDYKGDSEEE